MTLHKSIAPSQLPQRTNSQKEREESLKYGPDALQWAHGRCGDDEKRRAATRNGAAGPAAARLLRLSMLRCEMRRGVLNNASLRFFIGTVPIDISTAPLLANATC